MPASSEGLRKIGAAHAAGGVRRGLQSGGRDGCGRSRGSMGAPWYEIALILVVNLIISFAAGCATERSAYVRALKTPAARRPALV